MKRLDLSIKAILNNIKNWAYETYDHPFESFLEFKEAFEEDFEDEGTFNQAMYLLKRDNICHSCEEPISYCFNYYIRCLMEVQEEYRRNKDY